MHPADINAALTKKGITQEKLIEGTPYVQRSTVSLVIHGHRRSPYLERRISQLTGISLHKLWPNRYDRHNNPRNKAA